MRKFRKNTHGVSNIIGYMFSFAVASMVMVSAVFITIGIVDDKTSQVARIEAQNIANYVANTVAEMVAMKEANPNAEYSKAMDIPLDLAGKSYYIEVTENRIYVNTTDGYVTASSTTYHADELNIGASGKISGGGGQALISSKTSDYVYKLDFGTGNATSHSPVETGYYHVGGATESIGWGYGLDDFPYRTPIRLYNPSSKPLVNMPVKIVLNSSNFDYDHATVIPVAGSGASAGPASVGDCDDNVISNLNFYDPGPENVITMVVVIDKDQWYPHWNWSIGREVIITIDLITAPSGMTITYINGDTLKLGAAQGKEAVCKDYNIVNNKLVAVFDQAEAFQSLNIAPEDINEGPYTLPIGGEFLDGNIFSEPVSINVIHGDIYVKADADPGGDGSKGSPYQNISDALLLANDGDTIYVYEGTYNESFTITEEINLVGRNRETTIISGDFSLGGAPTDFMVKVSSDNVNISSFTIEKCAAAIDNANGDGLELDGCSYVNVTNCIFQENNGDGIKIQNGADHNIIKSCISKNNLGESYGAKRINGDGIQIQGKHTEYNQVIDCECYENSNLHGNGIFIDDGANHNVIEHCTVHDNDGNFGEGIEIWNEVGDTKSTRNNTIINCTIYGQNGGADADGIDIASEDAATSYPTHNWVINCTSSDNGLRGVLISNARGNHIVRCKLSNNGEQGIYLLNADNNQIINCEVDNNEYDGIYLSQGSEDNQIENCTIYDNGDDGISITGIVSSSNNNTVSHCDIYKNGYAGIFILKSMGNSIRYCNVYGNKENDEQEGGDGLEIKGGKSLSVGNLVEYCNFYDNEDAGIQLTPQDLQVFKQAHYNDIRHCNVYCNKKMGIFIGGINCTAWETFPSYPWKNDIYKNNIRFNGLNACDATWRITGYGENKWDDGSSEGNYWSDLHENSGWDPDDPPSSYYDIPNCCDPGYDANEHDNYPMGPYYPENDTYPEPDPDNLVPGTPPDIIQVHMNYGESGQHETDWYHTKNITWAVDHVMPDGTVLVHAHKYMAYIEPTITIDKPLKLIGVADENEYKPIIIHEDGSGPVIKVDGDYNGEVYIDSFYIQGGDMGIYSENSLTISNCTIHDNTDKGIFLSGVYDNVVENCEIYNSDQGIELFFGSNNNIITNCYIRDNEDEGIQLNNVDGNNINNCTIEENQYGVRLSVSDNNRIENCSISYNEYGLSSGLASEGNTIIDCEVSNSGKDGILIKGTSNFNNITRCNIHDNALQSGYYGVNITSSLTNNNIFYNIFEDNGQNANDDSGSNTWDDDDPDGNPPGEGNYWDDYEGIDGNFDGIGDTAYVISASAQDNYPVRAPWKSSDELRDYSVDYWNPYGESVILVNLNIDAYEEKDIYLYYGNSSEDEEVLYIHSSSDTAVFFDDFNGDSLGTGWAPPSRPVEIGNSRVTFDKGDYIVTNVFSILEPEEPNIVGNDATSDGAMYVVEAQVKLGTILEETQGNMVLLSQGANINDCYIASNHFILNSGGYLKLHKKDSSTWHELCDNASLPSLLTHWQRMTAYVYVGRHAYNIGGEVSGTTNKTNATKLSVTLYDFTSYSEEGTVSDTDGWISLDGGSWNDPPGENDGTPYLNGRIGLGCGLNVLSSSGNFTVDWIKVRRMPITTPTVTIGATESKNYGWLYTEEVYERNRSSNDPYKPGPLLRDFHEGHVGNTGYFYINGLAKGTYTITVTMGDNAASCPAMDIIVDEDCNRLHFDATSSEEFSTKSIIIDKTTNEDNALSIEFSGFEEAAETKSWTVNTLTIERGERGVKLS